MYRARSHAAGQRAGAGHGPAKRPLGLRRAGLRREHSSFCSVSCPLHRKSLLWEGMLCGPEGEWHGEGNAGCPYTATALVPEENKLVQIKVWAAGIACCVRFPLQGAWREAPVCRALSGRGVRGGPNAFLLRAVVGWGRGREAGGRDSLAVLALAAGRSRPHASASPSVEWERWLQHVWGMAVPS